MDEEKHLIQGIPEESLKIEEMAKRVQARESFRTPQMWGASISIGCYLIGSSALMNDDNADHLLAAINYDDEILSASPTTYVPAIESLLGKTS